MGATSDEQRELSRRSIVAVVCFELALLAIVFVPACTLRFWQAWVYWVLFSSYVVFGSWYFVRHDPALVRRRLAIGPAAEPETSQKVFQGAAAVLIVAVHLVPGLDHRFGWSAVPAALVWAGDALMMAGWLFVFRVLQTNSFAFSTVRVEPGQRVVSTGPYAWIRHPMYAGATVALLATPLALGSYWALLPAVLLCAAIVLRLRAEERYLTEHLPGYAAYRDTVPWRLVPGIW